jgi:hypothetical protein
LTLAEVKVPRFYKEVSVLLNSWKEIAAYLAVGVRTAQRWEVLYGMPVHRLPGSCKGAFALANEIDEWLEAAPVRRVCPRPTVPGPSRQILRAGPPAVLVVDDNDAHLYALHKALTAAGFQVLSARSGSDAIMKALLRRGRKLAYPGAVWYTRQLR